MIQIYCGDGKGKTTAALGLAVRAAGREKRVLIARFLKTDDQEKCRCFPESRTFRSCHVKRHLGFTFA